MNIENLKEIETELKRFQEKLQDCFKKSRKNLGYVSEYGDSKGKLINVGDFSYTKESGAIKRAALDLKICLTENCSTTK